MTEISIVFIVSDCFFQDYMDDVHGKEINLQKTTVKIPGALRPRGSGGNQNIQTNPNQQNGEYSTVTPAE